MGEEWGIIQTYTIECNPSKIMLDIPVINDVGQSVEIMSFSAGLFRRQLKMQSVHDAFYHIRNSL